MTINKVVLLGHGEMGHAFEHLLQRHTQLSIWTRSGETAGGPALEQVVADADALVFCLPVVAHAVVAERLAACLAEATICISIAKGLDEAGKPAAQILDEYLPRQPHVLMYGPMIAEEIIAGRAAFAQLGTGDAVVAQRVEDLFRDTPLYLQTTSDITGISWAVILKNVYAILFGAADELALGDNMRGHLMAGSLAELSRIVQQRGGEAHSPFGLAGLGDLTTTATSESSHHHSLGRCLARNDCKTIDGEGVHTLRMVVRYDLLRLEEYPLFRLCQQILDQPSRCRALFHDYLAGL